MTCTTWTPPRTQAEGAQRLSLDTARSNLAAQALYESLGYEAEQEFVTYHKVLDH
ncbi:N-acetyltransferase [Pseudomonas sp. FW305-17]|uniref:GNAT family N-acetyltransferase n=1 Tax=Pseudomonas sp. FW305-17 TaxID=2070681 RepID=UPI00211541F0|nr:hypothetical protein [Pseudomonas sp. FW305-17]